MVTVKRKAPLSGNATPAAAWERQAYRFGEATSAIGPWLKRDGTSAFPAPTNVHNADRTLDRILPAHAPFSRGARPFDFRPCRQA